MKTLLTFVLLLFPTAIFCQTVAYHQYQPTASDYHIVRWNIPKDSLKYFECYVEEQTDERGRVVQLRFLYKGDYLKSRLCYLPDFVRYEYPNTQTIIQSQYNSDSTKMNGLECEVAYRITYTINREYVITDAKLEYYTDTAAVIKQGFSKRDIEIEMTFIKKNASDSLAKAEASQCVFYYLKSFYKMDKHFPAGKSFAEYGLTGNDPESAEVRNCLWRK